MKQILEEIGLTGSEVKVYLALLELHESSKGAILKKSKIAHSKVYHVLQKLIDKGLASSFLKNNVKHFRAAPPDKIKAYLKAKKKKIAQQEEELDLALPKLQSLFDLKSQQVSAEIFHGWQGMKTVYDMIIKKAKVNYIIGASKGENTPKTRNFFLKHSLQAIRKGIKKKVIFNESARSYVESIEKEGSFVYDKRFLSTTSPVEINIFSDYTAIVRLKKEPIVFLIKDPETAESFRDYFKILWATAK